LNGVDQSKYYRGWAFDRERYERACAIYRKHLPQLHEAAKKRISAAVEAGFPRYNTTDFWHADHIIPFSEEGDTSLDNMRTLCVPCHKKITKEWRASLKSRRLSQEVLPLA
jgi:5-methylcytosine-specific restriction enzyme A